MKFLMKAQDQFASNSNGSSNHHRKKPFQSMSPLFQVNSLLSLFLSLSLPLALSPSISLALCASTHLSSPFPIHLPLSLSHSLSLSRSVCLQFNLVFVVIAEDQFSGPKYTLTLESYSGWVQLCQSIAINRNCGFFPLLTHFLSLLPFMVGVNEDRN